MDVLVLGPLEVRRDGEPVHVRRGRPRRLLLSLLLQQGGAVAPQTLIDQLWGDQQPVNADNALQLLVSHLRRVLAGTGARIERTAVGYRLVVDPEDVDAFRFERLVRAARAAVDPGERFRLAAEASSLWRGAPLSEAADDDFAVADVVRLEELRLSAEELRLEALLALGGHDEALPDLDRAVRAWPYRERFAALHVLALYRAGRQADALAALGAARSVLAADLGLDPGPELRQLEERILRQDPELGPPVGAPLPGATTASAAAPTPPGPASAPTPLTALVGREEELAAVAHALAGHRLVTLTGPGGTGKSRLAAEVARAETGPVWWCDLSGVTAGEQVPRAVATAAGTAGADPVQALRCSIGDLPVLLVLDTCEHVLPAVAELTGELTAACPALRVLASSRRPLGLPGEQVRPVPPLPLPGEGASADDVARSAAVRLFCERAAAVRPAFALDERNAADVARICRLLDGLPLALELAAATAAALSPASIADLLSDRLRLIGGEGGRGDRHAGLRATIGWSYGLLSAEEALFLDRLSVFAGPFAAEVAVEVAGAGLTGDGLELLLRLVGHSLVAVQENDRFRLLDTVRAFAAERLAARGADEQRALRERHARWYLAFAREADAGIRGADQAGWLADLRLAVPDLRAALTFCLTPPPADPATGAALVWALSWYWSFDGAFAEAGRWIEAALAAGPHDLRTAARLRLASATHAESLGRLGDAERDAAAAAAAFTRLGEPRGEAESLLHVGTTRWVLGDLGGAAVAHEKAAALYRSAGDDAGTGIALVLRARTALEAADPASARRWLAEADGVLLRARDAHLTALALEQSARCALFEGDLVEAERLASAAARSFEAVGYAEGLVASRLTLGRVRAAEGDAVGAATSYRDAAARAGELAHPAGVAEGLEHLAGLTAASGDPAAAARLLGHAEGLRQRTGTPRTPLQDRGVRTLTAALDTALGDERERLATAGRDQALTELLERVP